MELFMLLMQEWKELGEESGKEGRREGAAPACLPGQPTEP